MNDTRLTLPANLSDTRTDPVAAAGAAPADRGRGSNPLLAIGRILAYAVIAVIIGFLLFLTVGPLVLPYKALVVYSGSMEPTIPVGSVVILTPVQAGDVKVNDVITFQRPDNRAELVTHRVIAIETGPQGKAFVTKGDANNSADAWRVLSVGSGWRYQANLPYVGYLLAWLQSPLGRILFLIVPAAALGLLTLYELWAPRRTQRSG
jgi:signal peptidase